MAWRDIVNGPGKRDLDFAVGVGAQKFDVAHLDRPQPADRADDARHDDGAAGAPHDVRRVVEIDPRKCGRKTVRIAFAADLAIGDDVDPGALHVADRQPRRIVLGRFEPGLGHPPQFLGAHPHRSLMGQLVAVDQPVGLRIAADHGGRKKGLGHGRGLVKRAFALPAPRSKHIIRSRMGRLGCHRLISPAGSLRRRRSMLVKA